MWRSAARQLSAKRAVLGEYCCAGSLSEEVTASVCPSSAALGRFGFSGLACRAASHLHSSSSHTQIRDHRYVRPWHVAGSASIGLAALNGSQARTFIGWFRRKPADVPAPVLPELEPEVEPAVDLEVVNQIVDMTTGIAADQLAWQTIHHGVSYPTYGAQLLLKTFHDYGALGGVLPWPLAILAAVLTFRCATAPLMIMQMKSGYNMGKARPLMEKLQQELQEKLQRGGDIQAAQQWYLKELQEIWRVHNSSPFTAMLPLVINLPIFIGMYWGMSTMCEGGLPSLALESVAWIPDLAKPDPTHTLALAVPATLWMQMQLGSIDGLEGMSPEMRAVFIWGSRIAPPLMVPILWNMPSALCLYWTYSNCFSICMTGALRFSSVRRLVGLPSRKEMIEVQIQQQRRAQQSGTDFGSMWRKQVEAFSPTADATKAKATAGPRFEPEASAKQVLNLPKSRAQALRARKGGAHRKASG